MRQGVGGSGSDISSAMESTIPIRSEICGDRLSPVHYIRASGGGRVHRSGSAVHVAIGIRTVPARLLNALQEEFISCELT